MPKSKSTDSKKKSSKASELKPKTDKSKASDEEPKVGVFVCKCGLNIGGVVDCEAVADYAKDLGGVAYSEWNTFTCSDSSQKEIAQKIKEEGLNRVVVASCSPRLHEQTFRRVCEDAGLNQYLFEMANIREHCSWVHMNEKDLATDKAKDLVKMAVAKAKLLEPLESITVPVTKEALVLGGGVAGQRAALDIADLGFKVHLVERQPSIGGVMAQLDKTFPTLDCSICIQGPMMSDVGKHKNINLLAYHELKEVEGFVGNFVATVERKPRYVDTSTCTGCGECFEVCPVIVPNEFDEGLGTRPAIYRMFPQVVPNYATIDIEHCIDCGLCEMVCEKHSIKKDDKAEEFKLNVGTIITSTGYDIYDPSEKNDYGYLDNANVITALELERLMNAAGPTLGHVVRPSDGADPEKVAFILCVGTRDRGDDSYCSVVCCTYSLKLASMYKEKHPEAEVTIFYIDMRASGKGYEELYTKARQKGIRFIRGKPAYVKEDPETKNLTLTVENTLAGTVDDIDVDLLVLSTGMVPKSDAQKVSQTLHISRSGEGFFMEKHPKLAPVETATDGVYLSGACQGAKDIPASVAQARGAAVAAAVPMVKGEITIGGDIARHFPELCSGCSMCVKKCPYGAWEMLELEEKLPSGKPKKISSITEALCKGCGTCAADCPKNAIEMKHFTDAQIMAQLEAALEENPQDKILGIVCNWCTYGGADNAGVSRMQYPTNLRLIRVMCTGRIARKFVERAFELGAGMVLVSGCHEGDCHYITGNQNMAKRENRITKWIEKNGIEPERFRLEWISASEGTKFQKVVKEMADKLKELGPPAKIEAAPAEEVEAEE